MGFLLLTTDEVYVFHGKTDKTQEVFGPPSIQSRDANGAL